MGRNLEGEGEGDDKKEEAKKEDAKKEEAKKEEAKKEEAKKDEKKDDEKKDDKKEEETTTVAVVSDPESDPEIPGTTTAAPAGTAANGATHCQVGLITATLLTLMTG